MEPWIRKLLIIIAIVVIIILIISGLSLVALVAVLVVGLILYRGRKIKINDVDNKYIYFFKAYGIVGFIIKEIGNDDYQINGQISSDGVVEFLESYQLTPDITSDLIKAKYATIKDETSFNNIRPLGENDFYVLIIGIENTMILYHYTFTGKFKVAECAVKDDKIDTFELTDNDYSQIKDKIEDLFKKNINTPEGDYIIPKSELF